MQKIIQRAANALDRSPDFFRSDVRLYELNRRFLWFIVFRFVVVSALLGASLTKTFFLYQIFNGRAGFLIMAVILLCANLIYWAHYKHLVRVANFSLYSKRLSWNIQVQITLDFMVLGYLAYRCGGVESPLVYFFLFHNVISCLFFQKKMSFVHTLLSLAIIFLVSLGPFFGFIPVHHFIFPAEAAAFYDNPVAYFYSLGGIVTVYLVVWFFAAGITDSLKRHEQRLQSKIDDLVAMDKEKTRYMLVTTHELKAPFSSIQSYVNVVLGGYAGDVSEKVRDIMWKIKLRCEILMGMITEMIQLANISSLKGRKGEVVKKRLDMMRVIATVARRFKDAADAKNTKIVWPEGLFCEVLANAEQLDILFNNLLSNAVNYCYQNTTVKIDAKDEGDCFLVTIEDKGIGIKKEHLEKVFLEYFRTEAAALINRNSTGLGLPIARQIVEIHGGRIWIESEEKAGTKVFVKFPKRE